MERKLTLIMTATALVLAGCRSTEHASRWEYKTISCASNDIPKAVISEGWRPVSFAVSSDGQSLCRLERPKPGTRPELQSRADYVRATLPYDSAMLVSAATRLRKENPTSKQIVVLDELIRDHLLRLHVCLADPKISEVDKKYARDVWPKVVAYASDHSLVSGFDPGRDYFMLEDDIVLPDRMAIRDVIDDITEQKK